MAEVYSWPEGSIYLFPSGGPSAVLAFGEQMSLSVDDDWRKYKNMGTATSYNDRTRFVRADRTVTLQVGMLHANQSAWQAFNSATAFNASLNFRVGALAQSGTFLLTSAVFRTFSVQGQDGALFRASVTMEAADVSGL